MKVNIIETFISMGQHYNAPNITLFEEHEIAGMQHLNDGNAEYLSANHFIVYDYTMYYGWYTTDSEDKAAYYDASYSDELQNAIAINPDDPFNSEYYDAIYASANEYWVDSDSNFELASQWDNRGDGLQRVMLIMALGLDFAAWASLVKEESNLRFFFGLLPLISLVIGIISYLGVPSVPL